MWKMEILPDFLLDIEWVITERRWTNIKTHTNYSFWRKIPGKYTKKEDPGKNGFNASVTFSRSHCEY